MGYEGDNEITFMESVQSRRVVYLSCYSASRATVPATKQQDGQTKLFVGGGLNLSTTSTLRAADATNGLYFVVLTQSECSAVGLAGPATIRFSDGTTLETRVNINFTKLDSSDSMRFGAFALPNAAAAAAGGLLTLGTGTGQITPSGGSVGIVPGTLSGVSVEVKASGIVVGSIAKGNYSGVSQEILTGGIQTTSVGAGTYSSVTVQGLSNYANISNVTLAAGTHSNVTIQGVTRVNSGVTLNADVHSGASVEIKAGGIQVGSLGAATITAAKFASGAIDAVALATDAGQEIADRILLRGLQGGNDSDRSVGQAFAVLRNKVAIDGSTVTVYQVDDSTSMWTGTVTTGTNPISGVDPL